MDGAGGVKLAWSEMGAGAPVCLLHGLFGRARNLAAVARVLAAGHRVISMDLRNHGASPHGFGMAYADLAGDVLETLAAVGVGRCALLGHSMGGKVAMMAALRAPEVVARLVVADIAPVPYAHHNAAVAGAMAGIALRPGLDRRAAEAALAGVVGDPAVRGFLLQNLLFGEAPAWRIGLAEIAAGMAEIEGWPMLGGVAPYGGPALFIAGGASDYVSAGAWPAIRALFPRARGEVLAGAGHWLHAEQPEAFAAAVAGFLAEAA